MGKTLVIAEKPSAVSRRGVRKTAKERSTILYRWYELIIEIALARAAYDH